MCPGRKRISASWGPAGLLSSPSVCRQRAHHAARPRILAGRASVAAVEDDLEAVDAVGGAFVVVLADIESEHAHAPVLGEGKPKPYIMGAAVDGETV